VRPLRAWLAYTMPLSSLYHDIARLPAWPTVPAVIDQPAVTNWNHARNRYEPCNFFRARRSPDCMTGSPTHGCCRRLLAVHLIRRRASPNGRRQMTESVKYRYLPSSTTAGNARQFSLVKISAASRIDERLNICKFYCNTLEE